MPAAVVQLFADLAAIPAGSTATDAQHQALVADLDALAVGLFTPDPATVDQLATDIATAATGGLLSDDVLAYLADDFIGDPDDPASWLEDIQDDVAGLINPSSDTDETLGATTSLPIETSVGPLPSAAGRVSNGSTERFVVALTAQGIPPGLLENYSGRVQLTSRHFLGIGPLMALTLDTAGLPPSNPYTVSITRRSDGTSVVLGKFRVHDGFFQGIVSPGRIIPPSSGAAPAAEFATISHVTLGGLDAKKALPADYNPADVATLTVTDAQGVVRLSGDIATGQRESEFKKLNLYLSGTPAAQGRVASANLVVRHKTTLTKTSNGARFRARHLPANTQVLLLADGTELGSYTTTTHGRLLLVEGYYLHRLNHSGGAPVFNGLLPDTDLTGTKVFSLTDTQGNVLLSGTVTN